MGFILRAAFAAMGLWLATYMFDGLQFDEPGTLIAAALLLGVVNAVIRPLVLLLTLPLTIFTLGFFLLVVNAAMLGLVALVLDGFHVQGFWTAAGTSLVVSIVSGLGAALAGDKSRVRIYTSRGGDPFDRPDE